MKMRIFLTLFAAGLSLLAGPSVAADGDDIPGSLAGTLSGKPKYPKLDSQLNRLATQAAQSGQGGGDVITTSALMYSGTSVAVTVHLTRGSDAIADFITEGGGIAANVGEDYVEAYVPPPLLAALSELEGVLRVDTVLPPQPHILSQGRASHGVPAWNTRGLTGAGVKVGIIDAGFEGFAALMGTELPSTVTARCYTSIGVFTSSIADCENGEVHGTAVAEAIVDIAPQATLYVANEVSGADGVAIATWMAEQGVTVINRSLGSVWQGPGDGTSPNPNNVFTMIDTAVSGGALFANSAGNSAEETWYGTFVDSDSDRFHEFSVGDPTNTISASQGQVVTIELRWNDTWGGASRDLNLGLYDSSLSLVASSIGEQSGGVGHIPYERLTYLVQTSGTYHLGAFHFAGTAPSWLQIRSFSGQGLQHATAARSVEPASESFNPGLLAVGAAPWFDDDTIESFSSQGPTIDGRTKPDIVGVDGGTSATYGPGGFFGTSQATPHVAGLAALVKQRFPSMTPSQVATYLKANALARGTAPNNTWGFGLAQLPAIEPGAPSSVEATPGDGQATATWNAPADGGSTITGYTVTASPGGNTAAVNGSTLSAVVTGLANGTGHTFTVTATNAIGTGEASTPSASVTPSGPPDPPTGVAAVAGNGLAAVSWTAPASDGGSPITSYNVTSTPGGLTATVDGSTLSAVVTGLSNGTSYVFNVGASNAVGSSGTSTSSAAVTPAGPPDPPTGVSAVAGDRQATVDWDAPVFDGGSPIIGYSVTSNPDGITVAVDGSTLSASVTGLTKTVPYTFTVTATNTVGTSEVSTSSVAVTPVGPPDAPTGVAATPSDGQATVTWNAAANGGSTTTGYTVTASPGGNTTAVGGATLIAVVSGLANGTPHTFTLVAANAVGTSTPSAPSAAVTPSGPSDPPTGVTSVAGNGQATVAWTAPASDGGSPITSYNVTSTPGNLTAAVDGSTLSAIVTGLTNGTAYTFVVGANNGFGASGPSAPSATSTPTGPPLAPLNVTAIPGNTQAAVSWSAPSSDGGSPITQYNIVSSPDGLTQFVNGSELTGLVTGLTNGTAYTFTVTALNALGASPPSTSSPSVVPRRLPDAPTNVRAIAGDESATITWDAPDDGGSPILQYNVSSTPEALGVTVDASTLNATVTGLTNFVAYTFTVTAVNVVGSGLPSAQSNEVTPPNDPPEVTVSPSTTGDEGALLSLQLASFTDSDVADTHTASVDWGDGTTTTAAVVESGGAGTITASHTYVDDGDKTVTVTVTDSFGGATSDSFTIVIGNVAPTVLAESNLTTAGLTSITPSVHFTDIGILDTHSAEIDWGDGATSTAVIDAARRFVKGGHTYSSTGQFTVTVTVTDNAGDSGSDGLTINVTSAPVAVSIPSLSTWGLVAMALALVAAFALRRRSFDRLRMSGDQGSE